MTQDQIIFNMQSKLKIDSPMIMTGKVTNHFMICNLTINWDYNGAVIIIHCILIFDCFILRFEVAEEIIILSKKNMRLTC